MSGSVNPVWRGAAQHLGREERAVASSRLDGIVAQWRDRQTRHYQRQDRPVTQAQAPDSLARLLFVSQSTHPLGHASDIDVFRSALDMNERHGICGVILRGERWFCQVLEGCGPRVEETLARIRVDHRHGMRRIWWQTDAPTRMFSDWHTEHWGVSPQIESVFLDMLLADDVPLTDKITLVRAFATMQRARARLRQSGAYYTGNVGLHRGKVRKPVDTA